MKRILTILAILSLCLSVSAKALTNDDVLMMLEAGLGEDTILVSINNSQTAFDTTPMALVELKKAKVPDAIIQAMINPGAAQAQGGQLVQPKAADRIDPEIAILKSGGSETIMRYTIPAVRTAARGLGFGGVATYSVLRGSHASLKISDRRPVFILSVPQHAQPESYIDLASYAVRKNNSREVLIGGGYMSYSTGIHPDRRIPTNAVPVADQSKATDGFILYELTPAADLAPGEYGLILYNAEIKTVGFFGHGSNSCFDFAVQ